MDRTVARDISYKRDVTLAGIFRSSADGTTAHIQIQYSGLVKSIVTDDVTRGIWWSKEEGKSAAFGLMTKAKRMERAKGHQNKPWKRRSMRCICLKTIDLATVLDHNMEGAVLERFGEVVTNSA